MNEVATCTRYFVAIRTATVILALSGHGCASSALGLQSDAAASDGIAIDGDSSSPFLDSSSRTCGSERCSPEEYCCYGSGRCVSNLDHSSCVFRFQPQFNCAADRDCAAGQFCDANTCLGTGFCNDRGGTCVGIEYECGCDGVTYNNSCDRMRAGVRRAAVGRCGAGASTGRDAGEDSGVVGCGSTSQCPQAYSCCSTRGVCVPVGCTTCCPPLDMNGVALCFTNDHCVNGARYCNGTGCGSLGHCENRQPRADCSGAFAPVCGCDGRTYSNSCWASVDGVRIDHSGSCDGG